jgi:hypothetical protein
MRMQDRSVAVKGANLAASSRQGNRPGMAQIALPPSVFDAAAKLTEKRAESAT